MFLGAGYLLILLQPTLACHLQKRDSQFNPLLQLDTGINLEYGSAIDTYDTSDGAYFKDEVCWDGCQSGLLAETEGRQIGADASFITPFCGDIKACVDAGYRFDRFQVWEDVGGFFVIQNLVKLYINLNGREREIVLDEGTPYIYLPILDI